MDKKRSEKQKQKKKSSSSSSSDSSSSSSSSSESKSKSKEKIVEKPKSRSRSRSNEGFKEPKKKLVLRKENKNEAQVLNDKQQKIEIPETDLIPALQEGTNFLMEKYNERRQKELEQQDPLLNLRQRKQQDQQPENEVAKVAEKPVALSNTPTISSRAGGVYVPPHKLRQIQQEIIETEEKNSREHQRVMWELLRKSINGIINKVNITNIQNIIIELLNENILRGKGLLARAIIKAQMAAPNFSHIYAALIAVINTKLPDIVNLLIRRVILQFQRSFKRNNKIVCQATIKMIAHLINQQVLSDYCGLQMFILLLQNPTEDSVELACQFMTECGQIMTELSPAGVNEIFERLKEILHEGRIERKVQYVIEALFAVRKSKFKEHPGVIPELDLVEADDQYLHNFELMDEMDAEEKLNIFQYDPHFEKTELEWEEVKKEILGEENILQLKTVKKVGEQDEEEEEENVEQVRDLTEDELKNLRRTLYLAIMNSVNYEECIHKILKLNIGANYEHEVVDMIIDCCMNERTYTRFFGLLSQRFCELNEVFRDNFMKAFIKSYGYIHKLETNKIRNCAKLFAHLMFTESIDWRIFSCVTLTKETTVSSGRIFLKILIQELSENMGLEQLNQRFQKEEDKEYFKGLFPVDHPEHTIFAINFYTFMGMGALSQGLRDIYEQQTKASLMEYHQQLELQERAQQDQDDDDMESDSSSSSSDSSSSSSSSSDSSDSDSSDSDSDAKKKKKKKEQSKKKDKMEEEKAPRGLRGGEKSRPEEKSSKDPRAKDKEEPKRKDKDEPKRKDKDEPKSKDKDESKRKDRDESKHKDKEDSEKIQYHMHKDRSRRDETTHRRDSDRHRRSEERGRKDRKRDR